MKLAVAFVAIMVAAPASAVCISTTDKDFDGVYVYNTAAGCSIDDVVLNSDLDDTNPDIGNPMTELSRTDGKGWYFSEKG
jgi:hypothetical protein